MKYTILFLLLFSFIVGGFIVAAPAPSSTTTTSVTQKANQQPASTATSATSTTPSATALPVPVAKVIWVKGVMKAIMPNNEIRILQKLSIVYLHDTITTEANSQAQIAFTDNTLMTFRADSKLYIDQYSFQPSTQNKKGSVGKYFMNLLEGGFRTITGLIAKSNPDDYKVVTPVATIGVRGTDFNVYVHGGEMFVGYIQGTPCVTSGSQQLCLDQKTPYANVPKVGAAPVALTQQPAVFKQPLEVVPVKIGNFTSPTTGAPSSVKSSGEVNSFCIQ